ncbi:regulatory protein, FmdB family [Ralstonia phage RSP15]|uniref:FmdB-like transcriptional regulator n=1 Tax=Ralstonia phage RSP15 TaxID=1785960 RepID=UPI00074D2D7F|nr:FmdB-like transcriptional regulator [Ralstonia phage RSP15]BAU40092.1 regulatory protein, FmdB family [Ralstonia phage RSP15]
MPYYEYHCTECEHQFGDVRKIDERDGPTNQPCPKCGGQVRRGIGAPRLVYTPGDNLMAKTPDGFKDRLREIKKNAGRYNTIDV